MTQLTLASNLSTKITSATEAEEKILLKNLSTGDATAFWILWQLHKDYLYRRCLRWMGGNPTEAQEALSRAMLKAWDKLSEYASKISNLRAWLTQLTHNLCVDIHREGNRNAKAVENMEALLTKNESPDAAIMRGELGRVIRSAIDALPSRLRIPFILRFFEDKSYRKIAQQLAISYDCVRKRIQHAREMLRKPLKKYLS